jgi:predicted dehydrogenase
MNKLNTIKVAIAGAGFIGPVHIESLRRLPNIEIVALCHSNEKAAAEKAMQLGIKNYYSDFDKMLQIEKPDCVHICTPNDLHYGMARAAIQKGIHVVCEKPLAMTVSEAMELLTLAKEKKIIHAVNFNIRYYPLVRQMKCMVEKGEVGNLFSVMGSYLQDWLFYDTDYNWRLEPDKTGDSKAIADIGSHLVDLIEYISGLQVTAVLADFTTAHTTRKKPLKNIETYSGKILTANDYTEVPVKVEDHANVLLRFNDGSKGVIMVSQVAAGRKNRVNLEFSGSKKSMAWCSESPNELWIGNRNEPNKLLLKDPSLTDKSVSNIISYPGGHNEGFGDTSKQLFKEIYTDVAEGKPSEKPPYPTFVEGLRELLLCEKIVESNRNQCWVTV